MDEVQQPTTPADWLYRLRLKWLGREFSSLPESLLDLDPETAWGVAMVVAVENQRRVRAANQCRRGDSSTP